MDKQTTIQAVITAAFTALTIYFNALWWSSQDSGFNYDI